MTPDEISSENLRKEGVTEEKIRLIGNIMIDTLEANRDKAAALDLGKILNTNKSDGSNAYHFTPLDKDYIA